MNNCLNNLTELYISKGNKLSLNDVEMVFFVLLAWHCLLRPKECLALLWCDLMPCHDEREISAVLRSRKPKIEMQGVQHVLVEWSWLVRRLINN